MSIFNHKLIKQQNGWELWQLNPVSMHHTHEIRGNGCRLTGGMQSNYQAKRWFNQKIKSLPVLTYPINCVDSPFT